MKNTESFANEGGDGGFSTTNTKPIIVVPSSIQMGNISIQNAKSFLQDGKYLSGAEECKLNALNHGETIELERRIADF